MRAEVFRLFGILLAVIKHTSPPPLQMLLNCLAILPKKTGDTRTVAIAATLYRS